MARHRKPRPAVSRRRRREVSKKRAAEFRWLTEALWLKTGWQREEILIASLCCRPSPAFGEAGFDGRYRAHLLASLEQRVGAVPSVRLRKLFHKPDGDLQVILSQVRVARRRNTLNRAVAKLVEQLATQLEKDDAPAATSIVDSNQAQRV